MNKLGGRAPLIADLERERDEWRRASRIAWEAGAYGAVICMALGWVWGFLVGAL